MDEPKKPRRRVVARLEIEADSWKDLRHHLHHLATQIAMDGRLSKNSISGGYSSGHIVMTDEDDTVTHESWEAENEAYCNWLTKRDAA